MIAEKIGGFSAGIVFILLMMYGLPEISGGHMKLLAKTAGKRRGIVEAAGEGDLGDGVAGGAEHLNGHAKPVTEQVLFGRELLFFHEDPVEIGPVNAGIAGHVGNPDGISIIVFQIFFGFLKIDLGGLLRGLRGLLFRKGKEQQEISGGGELVLRTLEKSFAEFFHLVREKRDRFRCFIPEDEGIGKNSPGENLRNRFSVKTHPGIAPGLALIRLIIRHLRRGNEKGISGGKCIGLSFVLINAPAL